MTIRIRVRTTTLVGWPMAKELRPLLELAGGVLLAAVGRGRVRHVLHSIRSRCRVPAAGRLAPSAPRTRASVVSESTFRPDGSRPGGRVARPGQAAAPRRPPPPRSRGSSRSRTASPNMLRLYTTIVRHRPGQSAQPRPIPSCHRSPGEERSVVKPGCDESYAGWFDSIDQTVLLVDTPGPSAGKLSAQRFRFTRSAKGVPEHSLDQVEDAQRTPPVGADPVLEVVKTVLVEQRIPTAAFRHVPSRPSRSRSCSMLNGMPSPPTARRLPSNRRCAFFGERSR